MVSQNQTISQLQNLRIITDQPQVLNVSDSNKTKQNTEQDNNLTNEANKSIATDNSDEPNRDCNMLNLDNSSSENASLNDIKSEGLNDIPGSRAGGIKALAWNLESLFDKIGLPGVCDFIGTFDVACLGETFTLPGFDFSIKFEDFIAVHWPAEKFTDLGRPSGGLVVLIRKTIKPFIEIIKTNINHVICLKIKKELLKTAKDLLYICTYIHPNTSIFYSNKDYDNTLDMLEEFLADEIQKNYDLDILLNGDLNARIGDWGLSWSENQDDNATTDFPRKSQDSVINQNGRKLIEICNTFGLTPLNGLTEINSDNKYTFISRRGNSVIDHYLCTPSFLPQVSNLKVINRLES